MTPISLLDQLVFAPAALAPATAEDSKLETSVKLARANARGLLLSVPLFLRGLTPSQLGKDWAPLMSIMRKFGIPVYAATKDFDDVPAAQVPARVAVRWLGQPLMRKEVLSADAFELASSNASMRSWSWPPEIEGSGDLAKFVSALSAASEGAIPIGFQLPVGASIADVRIAVEGQVDYVTLSNATPTMVKPERSLDYIACCLVNLRKTLDRLGGKQIGVLVDVNSGTADELLKLLALGASAINVAPLIQRTLPAQTTSPRYDSGLTDSLLGSLPPPKPPRNLGTIERALEDFVAQLTDIMGFVGIGTLAQFDNRILRAMDTRVAERLSVSSI